MTTGLRTEICGGIARMTMDRPEVRNALTADLLQAMTAFARRVETDRTARVLLITGTGDHFMAGGDVRGMISIMSQSKHEISANFEQRSLDASALWMTLERMPQPVVCKLRGFSAGAALSLVAGADFAVAADTARFVFSQVALGLVADAATSYHLPRAVGVRRAKQLAFFGDRIDAAEALAIGLVTQIVPEAELDAAVETLLQRIVAGPATSIAWAKRLMNASLGNGIAEQIALEGQAVAACARSDDLAEGVKAFVEKRKPLFNLQPSANDSTGDA
jgi:2-(1,2-epoxy-1,2-dihydrophenyl)acetyl-CoA isomerase